MAHYKIDINCDLGEISFYKAPHLIQLLDYISSCNVATGFHAGNPYTILKTIQEAHHRGLAIGAHPSYPDRPGFGRLSIRMSKDDLYASLAYQTSAVSGICKMSGARLHHIKLHGALYHDAHHLEEVAKTVIRFVRSWPDSILLYGQSGSILEDLARNEDINWVSEGFLDRRYNDDGHLLPRTHEQGVISEPETAIAQALNLIRNQKVNTINNHKIKISAQTLCLHGDHSGALQLVRQLEKTLKKEGITITPPQV